MAMYRRDHLETVGSLTAPQTYWLLTDKQRERICNGAGPKGLGWVVPDTMWGLDCKPCFDIHDYCYKIWSGHDRKVLADKLMLENLYEWIEEHTKGWYKKPLRWLRKRRAYKYYLAVKIGGKWFYNR